LIRNDQNDQGLIKAFVMYSQTHPDT